jgi:hypothetical protein
VIVRRGEIGTVQRMSHYIKLEFLEDMLYDVEKAVGTLLEETAQETVRILKCSH